MVRFDRWLYRWQLEPSVTSTAVLQVQILSVMERVSRGRPAGLVLWVPMWYGNQSRDFRFTGMEIHYHSISCANGERGTGVWIRMVVLRQQSKKSEPGLTVGFPHGGRAGQRGTTIFYKCISAAIL